MASLHASSPYSFHYCSVCGIAFESDEESDGPTNLNFSDDQGNHFCLQCIALYLVVMNSGPIDGHLPPTLQDHIHQGAASHTAVVSDTDTFSHYPRAASPSPPNSPPDQLILDSAIIGSRTPGRDKTTAQHGESRTEDPGPEPVRKRYFCELGCGKSFSRNTDQRRHCTSTAFHKSKKQWKCVICEAGFIRFDNFRQHMNRIKKSKGRNKQKCGHGFNRAHTSPQPENHEYPH